MPLRPSFRDRQRAVREDAILEAASILLGARGYAAMRMDEVSEHVGISKATLYQHVASKEELAVRVILALLQENLAAYAAAEAEAGDRPAIERLERVLRENLSRRAAFAGLHDVVPRELLAANRGYRALIAELRAKLTALVEEARADGDLRPELPTPLVVRLITQLFRGDFHDLVAGGETSPDAVGDAIVSILARGIRR